MSMYMFSEFVKEYSYYDFKAVSVVRYDSKHSHGFLYYLTKPIPREVQVLMMQKYDNIEFYHAEAQYAPEIQKPIIFIGNSAIRRPKW